MEKARITIIGLGQVGKALLKVLPGNNYKVETVYNRTKIPLKIKNAYPDISFKTGLPSQKSIPGDILFITVSDDAILSVSNYIAGNCTSLNGKIVVHCSGTHSSKILLALKQKGAKTASIHPMNAITSKTNSFEGIWFDMEGNEEALSKLEELASDLKAKTFRVEQDAKPFLHASAVVASNYLVVLADLVSKISAKGNVSEETALQALSPLMQNTLENIKELGVTDALTGPIVRGDVETVKQHLESLKNAPDLFSLYKILGYEAAKISERKNGPTKALNSIKKLLS